MGNNSIRSNLSKEDMISDIILTRKSKNSLQTVFLVVEGRDDIIFFKNRLQHDVMLYESFSGCAGVKDIIEFFSSDNIIGICDRDYNTASVNKNLFFYDYSCLEMMLISNDSAFESVCGTCYAGELSYKEIRDHILTDLKAVSILRKMNSDNKMGINFKGLSINCLCNNKQQKIDVEKIYEMIPNNTTKPEVSEIKKRLSKVVCYHELLQITNGHDFISYLQLVFAESKPPKSKTLSVDSIFMCLSIAFREEEFVSTLLYKNLKRFEILYNLTILK